jgi:hypothetical protein
LAIEALFKLEAESKIVREIEVKLQSEAEKVG